jgi:hypothetical protein
MSILLALLYPLAVQYERGGWWRVLAPVTLFTLVVDIIANYTELALLTWDFPKQGEYTLSTRLKRLQYDLSWRGELAPYIVTYLNFFAPNGKHV